MFATEVLKTHVYNIYLLIYCIPEVAILKGDIYIQQEKVFLGIYDKFRGCIFKNMTKPSRNR